MIRTFISQSEDETLQLGDRIAAILPKRVVVAFSGPLGSGKTTFIRGLVGHRTTDTVSSPTFIYHQRYGTDLSPIDHIDFYRGQGNSAILKQTGLIDLLEIVPGWLLIEWPQPNLPYPNDVPILEIQASGPPRYLFELRTSDTILSKAVGEL